MVTRYDVISSRWSSHFCVKMRVFSTIKVKLVDEMMQSAYLCVILHVQDRKIATYRDFNLISNSW